MSNIQKSSQQILDELSKKSLTQKVTDLKTKLAKYRNSVILCDVSGSMDSFVHANERAIDIVNGVLENFPGAQIYEFHSNCNKVKKLGEPRGSTNMGRAFETVKRDGHKEITLLTDGVPDSESEALTNAKGLKINIIYIGPQPTPIFLERLARACDGNFTTVELIQAGSKVELENKVRGFLGAGS